MVRWQQAMMVYEYGRGIPLSSDHDHVPDNELAVTTEAQQHHTATVVTLRKHGGHWKGKAWRD